MHISARSDYAVRAMLAVAQHHPGVVKAAVLAASQDIPYPFLQGILLDLRRAGLLQSLRGTDGGYALTRAPAEIAVGDVLRATTGALTTVRGAPAEVAAYHGVATGLGEVWRSVHRAIEGVVDRTSLADLLDRECRGKRGVADRGPGAA
ncbi:RrF2 family transcriptional regulator [Micromonospora andamanensis]|uniref:RrF2 family transcriptional regulator n=1 Tax=Micromonospora andamanensis TaxID=1287068 RepID=UPI0019507BED|nr:Rrf2 family transcriptional regulator [Micromonospora andamanensis]